jgi:hypothetical protein
MTPHSEERVKTLTARLKRVIRCANDRMVDDMRTVLRNAHLSHENVRLREDLDEARAERDRLQQALEEKALTLAEFKEIADKMTKRAEMLYSNRHYCDSGCGHARAKELDVPASELSALLRDEIP